MIMAIPNSVSDQDEERKMEMVLQVQLQASESESESKILHFSSHTNSVSCFSRPVLLSASSCAHACACPSAAQYELLLLVLCSCEWGTLSHINTFAPSRDDQCCFIFLWEDFSRGIYPHQTSVKGCKSLQNVHLIFQWGGQMSHYFLVTAVIVQLFFCNSRTLHSRSCERLVAHGPSLHLTDKYSHNCLFLASFTQRWPLSGTGLWCRIG